MRHHGPGMFMRKEDEEFYKRSQCDIPRLISTIRELQRQLADTSSFMAAIVHQSGGELRVTEYAQVVGPKGKVLHVWADFDTGDRVLKLMRTKPGPYRQLTPEDVMAELDRRKVAPTTEGGDK